MPDELLHSAEGHALTHCGPVSRNMATPSHLISFYVSRENEHKPGDLTAGAAIGSLGNLATNWFAQLSCFIQSESRFQVQYGGVKKKKFIHSRQKSTRPEIVDTFSFKMSKLLMLQNFRR